MNRPPPVSSYRASFSAGLATERLRLISAVKNDGFAESTVRIVGGNARTLKFEDSSFEDR
jgi:hypothetical protein